MVLAISAACSSAPEKRTLQYMNQEGFGKRYIGDAEEEDYVSIGDRIRVFDVLNPEYINSDVVVQIDGSVLLPDIGSVRVAGFTRSDLRAVLTERFSLYYEENDIVVDITSEGKSFWVVGEVQSEGRKPFTGNQTVFEAVTEAMPKRTSANVGRCLLVRGDPRDPLVMLFNMDDLTYGETSANYDIQENDIIVVPATLLAEFGYFLEALLFPIQRVLFSLGGALFGAQNGNQQGLGRGGIGFGAII